MSLEPLLAAGALLPRSRCPAEALPQRPLRRTRSWCRLAGCTLLVALSRASGTDSDVVEAHVVLRAAAAASAAAGAGGVDQVSQITEACVPAEAGEAWRSGFGEAIKLMLEKKKRPMQLGLGGMAQGLIELLDRTTCGELVHLQRFKEQAIQLRVLATSRGLGNLVSDVEYEPFKSLTIGDIDIHKELNALILAWQLKKSTEELGQALAMFLRDFANDPVEAAAEDSAEESTSLAPAFEGRADDRRTVQFWVNAMNTALARAGDTGAPVSAGCLSEELALRQGGLIDVAFASMMKKTRRDMQHGLRLMADDMLKLFDDLETSCGALRTSTGLVRLRGYTTRMRVLTVAKNLVNPGIHVAYEPMKALKVGGIDIHLELNRFISAWINSRGAMEFGNSLVELLDDFKEQEEDPDPPDPADKPQRTMRSMLVSAVASAEHEGGGALSTEFSYDEECFAVQEDIDAFVAGMGDAIEQMLKKRSKTMQHGLKDMAGAVDKLLVAQPASCERRAGTATLRMGATKLKKVTSRLVVDYGTHVKYEAMKSLIVGGVAIHSELNSFLAAWKLRSPEESGYAFGQLLRKLSTISGYDEL